jgi:hypothetical protein
MAFFAYIHCRPDGTPFYVGKGTRTRDRNFRDRSKYHKRVVAKYGQENILIGKLDCATNDIALSLEVGLIKCLRRMSVSLVNLTDGGEGNVGWKCPENVRRTVSEANRKRVLSPEQRVALGDLWRGKKRPEHSQTMQERGHWSGEKNPFFGAGERQRGAANHMARAISGVHPEYGARRWGTLQSAAGDLGVTIQAVSQALKRRQRSKGWRLEYANGL